MEFSCLFDCIQPHNLSRYGQYDHAEFRDRQFYRATIADRGQPLFQDSEHSQQRQMPPIYFGTYNTGAHAGLFQFSYNRNPQTGALGDSAQTAAFINVGGFSSASANFSVNVQGTVGGSFAQAIYGDANGVTPAPYDLTLLRRYRHGNLHYRSRDGKRR